MRDAARSRATAGRALALPASVGDRHVAGVLEGGSGAAGRRVATAASATAVAALATLSRPPAQAGDALVTALLALAALGLCALLAIGAVARRRVWRGLLMVSAPGLAALALEQGVRAAAGATDMLHLSRSQWVFLGAGVAITSTAARRCLQEVRARDTALRQLIRTDPLTRLTNGHAFEAELARELLRAARDGYPLCVAVADVDHFRLLNDTRGHAEADDFLRRLGAAWRDVLRVSDLVARRSEDEFAMLLRGCTLADALPGVERLRLSVPDGQTVSVGITQWNRRDSHQTLLQRARLALVEAKLHGRNQVKVALEGALGPDEQAWSAILEQLLEQRAVVAAYQPIVALESGGVIGYEALARPDSGSAQISVERMFTTAHQMGLHRELDWLCRRAAMEGAVGLDRGRALFINCSVGALVDPVHRVDQMLLLCEWTGREPSDVVLEITERELVGDMSRLKATVGAYRREGFRFAVDDVGEGHSTLEVLAAVAPEFVKIARSLVVDAGSVGCRAAIRAVVALASELGAGVIAEGIEVASTAALMRHLGVDLAQGYLFGRPAFPVDLATPRTAGSTPSAA